MNIQLKEIRKKVNSYFGEAKHKVRAFHLHGKMCIDVEYEDFHSENRVEQDVRNIIGDGCLLNVKRECSDTMIEEMTLSLFGKRPNPTEKAVNWNCGVAYEWMMQYERRCI